MSGKVEKATKDMSLKDKKKDQQPALIGITSKKEEDFSNWFQQICLKSELLDFGDVSGCYVLRPQSYAVWESIQEFFNAKIKTIGVRNAYFPMFVSNRVLEKEKDHVEGFAPEVAWVTRAGSSELEEPVALRPTSETVMYPYYAKWIRSHRDLPLRLNQWNNVIRWEFKHPQPFLRTREFLWQEGHTAHLTREGAEEEVMQILDFYYKIYTDLLAVPMIKGRKTDSEKFAGSFFSMSVEGYIPGTGRGIQGATSHCLGQNFSKMFNIVVEDPENPEQKRFVWQNSWGFSTRSIGVMIMVHSDNKGLVLPPHVAQTQAVVIPVGLTKNLAEDKRKAVNDASSVITSKLIDAGVRVDLDDRLNYSPGFKFNDAELHGVPLQIEVGPRDVANEVCVVKRRDDGSKETVNIADASTRIPEILNEMHHALYNKAKDAFDEAVIMVKDVDEMAPELNKKHQLLAPFCGKEACEDNIKDYTQRKSAGEVVDDKAPSMGAKTLCIPLEQPPLEPNQKCCGCDAPAQYWTLFGRSY